MSPGIEQRLERWRQRQSAMLAGFSPVTVCGRVLRVNGMLLQCRLPQARIFVLSMPAKSLAGLCFLLLYLPQLQDLIVERMSRLGDLGHSLGLLFKVPPP